MGLLRSILALLQPQIKVAPRRSVRPGLGNRISMLLMLLLPSPTSTRSSPTLIPIQIPIPPLESQPQQTYLLQWRLSILLLAYMLGCKPFFWCSWLACVTLWQLPHQQEQAHLTFQPIVWHSCFSPFSFHLVNNGLLSDMVFPKPCRLRLAFIQFIKSEPFEITAVSKSEYPADDEEKHV